MMTKMGASKVYDEYLSNEKRKDLESILQQFKTEFMVKMSSVEKDITFLSEGHKYLATVSGV